MKSLSRIARIGIFQGVTIIRRMLKRMRSHWQGDVGRSGLLYFCIPVGALFFGGGMVLSSWLFPDAFDWRYQVMCSLASPAKNPAGHLYWSMGIVLSILIGLPTCGYFASRFSPTSPRLSAYSASVLKMGYTAGILVGLESAFFPNYGGYVYKAHEIIAIVTIAGIYLGVAGFWYCLTIWLLKERRCPRWFGASVFFLPGVPMTGAMLSQAWLFFDPNRPGWVSREWITLGIPIWLSFAFWQWLAVCSLVFCICFLAFVLPRKPGEV